MAEQQAACPHGPVEARDLLARLRLLWSAVLNLGLGARRPRDREALLQALVALQVLGALERGYVRRKPTGDR
ncbi:uncharacterized protein SOCE26_018530 [Sorangium cellulosum]|uniref:Uncharacterized protein n=1 Tax=Sorangium cellulosum TaxID=56 RepID=A0A2L0EMG6_SORCE|nr:hypothetical protein [Sorangium cellulosum]AUX40452.1 uncharacterized protein SOCE26_018530 [Sorangium cellulosum]